MDVWAALLIYNNSKIVKMEVTLSKLGCFYYLTFPKLQNHIPFSLYQPIFYHQSISSNVMPALIFFIEKAIQIAKKNRN